MNIRFYAPAALLSLGSLLAAPTFAQTMDTRAPSAKLVPGFNSVDIGDRTLRYMCRGTGSPTVIVEQGAGISVETVFSWDQKRGWAYIVPKIEKLTRMCVYDRAGLGHTTALSAPRSSLDVAHDLHALLDKAAIAPPYVFAGQSLGGINARAFASEYPGTVVGMVLIDSSTPDQLERFEKVLPPRAPDESAILTGFRDGPDRSMQGGEWYDFKANAALALQPLGDIPLIVLSRTPNRVVPGPIPEELQLATEPVWQALQVDLTKLSTSSKQIIAQNAGHNIQAEDPPLVIDAISDVVKQARKATGNRK